jgi:predicted dinucleotide-binding enzyme
MKIGVIGAGRIGGNCARQAVKGRHDVMLSFSRDPSKPEQLPSGLGREQRTARSPTRLRLRTS